jgi:hypothetical protein
LQKICSNYDFKSDGRIEKTGAAINLIIKMLKRDANVPKLLVDKGIISILTPIVMEIEVSSNDTKRINLIRNACKVFAELTNNPN